MDTMAVTASITTLIITVATLSWTLFLTKREFKGKVNEARKLVAALSGSYNTRCVAEEIEKLAEKESVDKSDLKAIDEILSVLRSLQTIDKDDFKRYENLILAYLKRGYKFHEIPRLLFPDGAGASFWASALLIKDFIACDYAYKLQQDAEQVEIMLMHNSKLIQSVESYVDVSESLQAVWRELLSQEKDVLRELEAEVSRVSKQLENTLDIEELIKLEDYLSKIRRDAELQRTRINGYREYASRFLVEVSSEEISSLSKLFQNPEELEIALSDDIVETLKLITSTHPKRDTVNFEQYAIRIKRELARVIFNQIRGTAHGS